MSVTFYLVINQLTHEIKRSPVTLVLIATCRYGSDVEVIQSATLKR
jgi:hypothetical protein